jgi:hypothetical protein
VEYLVRWEDFPGEDEWVSWERMSAGPMVHAYWATRYDRLHDAAVEWKTLAEEWRHRALQSEEREIRREQERRGQGKEEDY